MTERLEQLNHRYEELSVQLSAPETYNDPALAARLNREQRELEPVVQAWQDLAASERELADAEALLHDEDEALRILAREEFPALKAAVERKREALQILLLPWDPADEKDEPVFVGRFNIGAVSLHLPMILAKSRQENRDFFEVLDYYLELIRKLHIRTYEYLGELRASTNPLAYCEGGFYGGHLKIHDKIKPVLKSATASFGITALNEFQQLYNKKSLVEDGAFAIKTMEYINMKVNEFKKEDGYLYAIYGTPAENLCGVQVQQFRKKYGIVENVSDRAYVSNSFHCHVTEDITPIEKQDLENRFWDLCNGGKIQYVKYPINYNKEAIKSLVRRAMDMGFYEGVNLSLAYCDDCGHEELSMDVCPVCGSKNLTKIDRMNGYLSYSRVKGDTRLNDAKMAEIAERKSM